MTAAVRSRRYFGVSRLLCAVPAALASAVLVTIVLGGLGRWTLPAVAGWVAAGWLLLAPTAERATVRITHRFGAPAGADAEWLAALRACTEQRCGARPGRFDSYVRDDPEPAAYAAGRRSIAVTTGFLRLIHSGALTHGQAVAVLLHEAGHHATQATRYALVAGWLTWPWRAVYRVSMRIGLSLPYAQLSLWLLPPVFVIAIVRTWRSDAPPERVIPVVALLIILALAIFIHPAADAAFARASEFAADDYAARLGAAAELSQALHLLAPCSRLTPWQRLRASHPTTATRLQRLTAPPPNGAAASPAASGHGLTGRRERR